MKRRAPYLVGLVLVGGVIAYLFSSAFNSALQYYVTVAELQAAPPPAERILKVGGLVKAGTLDKVSLDPVAYRFVLSQGAQSLPVYYEGLVPDTLHEGGEVVATGTLRSDGTFAAHHILAKCASKYAPPAKS